MVINFPRLFVVPGECTARPEQTPHQGERFRERVLDRVQEAFCGLRGHDSLLQFQRDRMFLKCVSCGYESPGWELNETPPTVVARVNRRRRAPAPPQLIGERRVAC